MQNSGNQSGSGRKFLDEPYNSSFLLLQYCFDYLHLVSSLHSFVLHGFKQSYSLVIPRCSPCKKKEKKKESISISRQLGEFECYR